MELTIVVQMEIVWTQMVVMNVNATLVTLKAVRPVWTKMNAIRTIVAAKASV